MAERSPGHRPKKQRGGPRTAQTDGVTGSRSKRRASNSDDPTKTGVGLRQKFHTGTVAELLEHRYATNGGLLAGPQNGPDVAPDDGTVHGIFDRYDTKFDDKQVAVFFDAIRRAEIAEKVEKRINKVKRKRGRPVAIGYRTLLVGMLLTAVDKEGCLASEIARTLYFRLHPASQRLLDIKPLPEAHTATQARQQVWRTERQVRAALRRFLATLDPSIHRTGKEMEWKDAIKHNRDLTPEEILDNHDALSEVCNKVLRVPYDLLPAKVKAKYRGSAGIDATPLRLHTKGRGIKSTIAPTDPNAGFYLHQGDHQDNGKVVVNKAFFAYDINLIVGVCDWLGPNQYFPALPLAMHLDAPGVDPAGAARRVLADLAASGHRPRYLAGDGLYANATADTFHNPARYLGWKLVLPVLDAHTGVQGSADGLLLVEGDWYCPSIPRILIDATKDFRADRIDLKTYRQRIADRATYLARNKGDNASGTTRLGCPASGTNPGVMCALKPKSEQKKFIGGPVLGVRRLKDRITPDPDTQTAGQWPKPCRQESVTLDLRADSPKRIDISKFIQGIPFGTGPHTDIYNALRQSQEGLHGFAKDDAKEALGASGKRRMRGYAAQSLFAAVLLAAAGIRKVRKFLAEADTDTDGNRYVKRHKRKGEHATTHLPPGTVGTRGDPAFDEMVETATTREAA